MNAKTYFLENLQNELKFAFKWMAFATEAAQKGDFNSANYDMTVALQHWIKCQNIRDRYVDNAVADEMNWKFFTTKALAMAKQELKEDNEK